ncbi:hypothetical protein [Moraxella sp. VT-16-12]|uniref:hypothetical protein n=1 Tax=Moraxella sp. VT-16-12 TaxID=2014877 RepID=UPI000B7D095E|nr:hypothetical protein [Moraxella sp. VT-16-12]TWV82042.1 hypothetical protein CEW93_007110 [Moraxella sp. VT-16-12]
MSHNSLKERISVEAIAHHRKRQIHQFGDYCYLTQQLLMSNPQGLKKHKVQSAIGISEKDVCKMNLTLNAVSFVRWLSIRCEVCSAQLQKARSEI